MLLCSTYFDIRVSEIARLKHPFLFGDCLMSSIMIEHIVGLGYTTISMVAHAVGDPDQLEAFTQHLSLVPTGEEYQPFSPQTACIRRAVKECIAVALDDAGASSGDAS